MTKEQIQQVIFKEKADYCGFDFRKELHEIIYNGFTYEDFICNPNKIIISKRFVNNPSLEDILIPIIRLMDKESINHIYTMNFTKIITVNDNFINRGFLISDAENGVDNLNVLFLHSDELSASYFNLRGYDIPYFIIKSKEYGTAIVFSSSNGNIKDEDTLFNSHYIHRIYEEYVYENLIENKKIKQDCFSYIGFINTINVDDFTDGEIYSVRDVRNSIIEQAKEYAATITERETIKYYIKKEKIKQKEKQEKEEKEKLLKQIYAYRKYIPLRTRYTVETNPRKLSYDDIMIRNKNVAFQKFIKEMYLSDIDKNKLPEEDKEILDKFPNINRIQELCYIKNLRESRYPRTFQEAATFIGVSSRKTIDNFTKNPNVFYISFGIISWITDEETIDLFNKEDINTLLIDCAVSKKSYKKFKRYIEQGILYISSIIAHSGTLTIVMGMKGDNYNYDF